MCFLTTHRGHVHKKACKYDPCTPHTYLKGRSLGSLSGASPTGMARLHISSRKTDFWYLHRRSGGAKDTSELTRISSNLTSHIAALYFFYEQQTIMCSLRVNEAAGHVCSHCTSHLPCVAIPCSLNEVTYTGRRCRRHASYRCTCVEQIQVVSGSTTCELSSVCVRMRVWILSQIFYR